MFKLYPLLKAVLYYVTELHGSHIAFLLVLLQSLCMHKKHILSLFRHKKKHFDCLVAFMLVHSDGHLGGGGARGAVPPNILEDNSLLF